jgi:NAD(P)-dependent dehydrogenase (short-subunit alcohol dehydrogenase family)
MKPLHGRTALVTGASRGIGAASARALSMAGATVILVSRSQSDLAHVVTTMPDPTSIEVCDLSNIGGALETVEGILERHGPVQILVNNAGVSLNRRSMKLDEDSIDKVLGLNVKVPLLLATALAPSMISSGGGSIINISSLAGLRGTAFQAAYSASKGAMDALTRSLACEWGPSNIRVNSVAPGVIVTEMWREGRKKPGVVEGFEEQIALRRWGEPEDVADVVVFLASDASRYITGQTLCVDGGMSSMTYQFPW